MPEIFRGRHTAQIEGPFVVFIIGMRINRLLAVRQWLPVASAMGPMVRHLLAQQVLRHKTRRRVCVPCHGLRAFFGPRMHVRLPTRPQCGAKTRRSKP